MVLKYCEIMIVVFDESLIKKVMGSFWKLSIDFIVVKVFFFVNFLIIIVFIVV